MTTCPLCHQPTVQRYERRRAHGLEVALHCRNPLCRRTTYALERPAVPLPVGHAPSETDEMLRERLLRYFDPVYQTTLDDLSPLTATGEALDRLAENLGMTRRMPPRPDGWPFCSRPRGRPQ